MSKLQYLHFKVIACLSGYTVHKCSCSSSNKCFDRSSIYIVFIQIISLFQACQWNKKKVLHIWHKDNKTQSFSLIFKHLKDSKLKKINKCKVNCIHGICILQSDTFLKNGYVWNKCYGHIQFSVYVYVFLLQYIDIHEQRS